MSFMLELQDGSKTVTRHFVDFLGRYAWVISLFLLWTVERIQDFIEHIFIQQVDNIFWHTSWKCTVSMTVFFLQRWISFVPFFLILSTLKEKNGIHTKS